MFLEGQCGVYLSRFCRHQVDVFLDRPLGGGKSGSLGVRLSKRGWWRVRRIILGLHLSFECPVKEKGLMESYIFIRFFKHEFIYFLQFLL